MSQSPGSFAALSATLARGETLPSSWYTDPGIAERELQQIFRRTWSYIGPLNELRNVGDYVTGMVGGIPVVVIRNAEGLAGLVNVCRHRRHEVMKGRGNAKVMQCGYHAWTYDLTGCLKGAPRTAAEPGFRLEDYPLLPLAVDTLGPWVFVNVDREAEPLARQYGPVLDLIARSGIDLDGLELHSRVDWESHSNWKTMLENYLECYHCAVAHPGFSAAIDVLPENYDLGIHGWFLSQVGHVRQSALEGRSQARIYDARGEVAQAQYHVLFPNMTININPGFPNLSIDVWRPNGPDGCTGFSEQYFAPGVTREFAEELIAFNRQVGTEDDDLTDSVQRGLRAGIPERGRFLVGAEHLVGHFQRLVAAAVTGTASDLKAVAGARDPEVRSVAVEPTASAAPESERNAYVPLEVVRVEPESDLVTSFYLRRADGKPLHGWEPGQFLPVRIAVPGQPAALRNYTLSTACNPDHYRLSIRRHDAPAIVSRFLHGNARTGLRLEALAPRGTFVLSPSDQRPAVLISGGVGITPMLAMAEHIVAEGRRSGKFRPVYFIHGARSGKVHAFARHVRALAEEHPAFEVHYCYSRPGEGDALGRTHDAEGRVGLDTLRRLLPFGDFEFYLCGPSGLMKSLFDGLTGMGVSPERIFHESFGPATVLKAEAPLRPRAGAAGEPTNEGVTVRFRKSATGGDWSSDRGTLLEFAESLGIAPAFGCRSGICGTCTTRLVTGAVDYVDDPVAPRGPGEVLLCCSVPRPGAPVVLDL